MTLAFHDYADLFPLIETRALDELAEDIRQHGVRDRIVLLDGRILDGRNRFRALQQLVETGEVLGEGWGHRRGECLTIDALDPPHLWFAAFNPNLDGDPLAWVISKNLRRRHLDESQRAMVAAKLANLKDGQRADKVQGTSIEGAATLLNVGRASVERARTVQRDGTEDLQHAVEQGTIAVSTAAVIALAPKIEQQRILEAAGGDEKKVLAAASDIRARQRAERFAEVNQRLASISENSKPLPSGQKYPIIYADPATRYVSGFSNRSAENHYPTMTTEELCALPVGELVTDDAVLFIWTTIPQLANTFDIARAWGFAKYCSAWCWDKVDQGPGHWAFNQHEELLIFTRGKFPAPVPGTQPRSVYSEKKTEHSAKPAWFAQQIERIWPELPKIELFCRSPRAGWAAWGNQADASTQSDIQGATEHRPAASLGAGQADVASADAARSADLSAPVDPDADEGAMVDASPHAPPAFHSNPADAAHGCTASNASVVGGAAELPAAPPKNSSDEDPLDIPAFLRRRPDGSLPDRNVVLLERKVS